MAGAETLIPTPRRHFCTNRAIIRVAGRHGADQPRPMESMTVRVRGITLDSGIVTALVTATSRERFKGQPVARIRINLTLPVRDGESPRGVRERVRGEALRFLDIA